MAKLLVGSNMTRTEAPPNRVEIDYSNNPKYVGYVLAKIRGKLEELTQARENLSEALLEPSTDENLIQHRVILLFDLIKDTDRLISDLLDYKLSDEQIAVIDEFVKGLNEVRGERETATASTQNLPKGLRNAVEVARTLARFALVREVGEFVEGARDHLRLIPDEVGRLEYL